MSAVMSPRRIFVILVILCGLECCSGQRAGSGTVLSILQQNNGLGKFASLIARADLTYLYNSSGQFTVFAPNNTAFESISYDERSEIDSWPDRSPQLQNFVKFHTLINNRLTTGDMQDNQAYQSMASNGERIFINRRQRTSSFASSYFGPTVYFVNGAEISNDQKDLIATNGVVQGLSRFIGISSIKMAYGYISDPDNPKVQTSMFYNLISRYLQEGYYSTLNELSNRDKKVTLFVPNDEAMAKIPSSKLSYLQQNPRILNNVLKAHIIPDRVLFTQYVNHNEGFRGHLGRLIRFRRPYGDQVYVNSEGVDASIVRGNITVYNGVIHVVDHLLGYVYNSVRETITQESPDFNQYLNKAQPDTRNALVQASGVNVFVPIDNAFIKLQGVPGVNLVSDLSQVDKMIRFHILKSYQDIEISAIVGGYESRQYRQTMYDGWNVTVYNDRNESWVQGGYVKARVVRPDLKAINGRVHLIDSILGIPYLDLPMLICDDLWLLRTYDYIRSVGMKNYLTDDRFTAKRCNFELYGYPPGYDYASNSYDNSNNNYGNNYQQTTFNPYSQQSNSYNPSNQVSQYDMGTCSGCTFTFFVPNSTAIDYFQKTSIGMKIMRDTQRLQYLFKRLLFEGRQISLQRLSNTNHIFTAKTGESIRILKSMDRDVKIQFSGVTANVISMDIGATNGLIHIIDRLLYVQEDLTRDVSRGADVRYSLLVIVTMAIGSIFVIKNRMF
ncbi:fasciclin-1-like [Mizuhopecten yessoensis]|uniref:Fasciclin-1 n=1 Tax=Mizuhopecten yessoensis TaxID=6573 RepID=A0A210PS10_MIZYE|nr:fasciclin-1-like [Mizuhopecten yessoensis]OWF39283.1 Fasciclin-1 [Mizuhopecten yessoensis]